VRAMLGVPLAQQFKDGIVRGFYVRILGFFAGLASARGIETARRMAIACPVAPFLWLCWL
jgi:hypothetical protein